MACNLLCICARLMGPNSVIFNLFAVSVEDISPTEVGAHTRRAAHKGRGKNEEPAPR